MFKQLGLYIKLIKLALASKTEVTTVVKENGWKSTRFWVTVMTIGLNVLGVIIGMLPAYTSMWIIFILALAYLVLRTISKMTATTVDDELVAALEEPLTKIGVDTKTEQIPAIPVKPVDPATEVKVE